MVDPSKMAALAKHGPMAPKTKPKPPAMPGKPPMGHPADAGTHGLEPEGEGAEDLATKYGDVIEMLEAKAPDIESEISMLDMQALSDPGTEDEDFADSIREARMSLGEELTGLIDAKLASVSWDEAKQIADHLHADSKIEDPDAFAGMLFHLAHTK